VRNGRKHGKAREADGFAKQGNASTGLKMAVANSARYLLLAITIDVSGINPLRRAFMVVLAWMFILMQRESVLE
jgi:hypothetical protein